MGDDEDRAEIIGELTEKVQELMRYSQSAEGLLNLMPWITTLVEQAGRIIERDPDLGVELQVAVGHLKEANDAIGRAFAFASTRCDVKLND
jgi:hypothetical protein